MTREKKEGLLVCPEECNNTGLIIFLTTLIVTVLHLTLATTVYLYLSKLKRVTRQKRFHTDFLANSRLGSLTPSTSSSISSLGRGDDTLSYADDGFATSSTGIEVPPNPAAVHLAVRLREELARPKASKWFGMPGEHPQQQQQPQNQAASMQSAFNRENVFFGQKEQRFLGINNYAWRPGAPGPNGK